MKWLNLEIATLHSERYIGEDPVGRATWLALLTYCAEQENGGFIADCIGWKDRKWQQVMGVTLQEVSRASGLWAWEGDGLRVWKYPVDKEQEVSQKRLAALNTNKARAAHAPQGTPVSTPRPLTTPTPEDDDEESPPPRRKDRMTLEEAKACCRELGLPESDGDYLWHHWESNGWKNGGKAVRNCRAQIVAWQRAGYMPSQKQGAPPGKNNGGSALSANVQCVLDQEELTRVESRLSTLRAGYSDHQDWSEEDKFLRDELKSRVAELKKKLGFSA